MNFCPGTGSANACKRPLRSRHQQISLSHNPLPPWPSPDAYASSVSYLGSTLSLGAANGQTLNYNVTVASSITSPSFALTPDGHGGTTIVYLKGLSATDVETATNNVVRIVMADSDASAITSSVNSGQLTFAGYVNNLITEAQSSTVPAIVTYDFFFGATPKSVGVDFLTNYASYKQTPAGGGLSVENVYVNLTASYAINNASQIFAASYSASAISDELTFFSAVYKQIFGYAPFQGAIDNYFKIRDFNLPNGITIHGTVFDYYKEYVSEAAPPAGHGPWSAADTENGARGAVIGTLLHFAEMDSTTQYAQATKHFLQDAAMETPVYQTPLIGTYLASSTPHL